MAPEDESLLRKLVGAKVESVVFVMDYLQLTLWLPESSPTLTYYAWPVVSAQDGVQRSYGDSGYRDALFALITGYVVATESNRDAGLVLRFGGGEELALRPTQAEVEGPEVAMLQMNDEARTWDAWRTGEHPFEAHT